MNAIKKTVYLILGLWFSSFGYAQEIFHNYYYDQKRSFFEAMPTLKSPIILIGDSLTNCGNWDELFPNQHLINRGISGDITLGVLDRMDEIVRHQPEKVLLLIGINDLAQGITPNKILENYKKILARIQQASPKTTIIIQSVFPTNAAFTTFKNHQGKKEQIVAVNTLLQQLAVKEGALYLDLFSHLVDSEGQLDKKFTNDGLHLMAEGYVVWAKHLKNFL
jgi:lysophospholipase L1-like esterase